MKPALRYIAIAGLAGLLTNPVLAQDNPADRTVIDLDGQAPAELLQEWQGGKRVLFWSVPDGLWIEVFHGRDVTGLVDDPRSYFKRIVAGGRQWQWRNKGFVPLIAEEAVAAGPASAEDFAAAIAPFSDDLAETPENSPANMTYLFRSGSGETIKGVRLATTSICAEGGAQCPLVVLREGQPPKTIFINLDLPWGFLEADGRVFVEYQLEAAVSQIDLGTGAVTQLNMIEPAPAQSPPRNPRYVE